MKSAAIAGVFGAVSGAAVGFKAVNVVGAAVIGAVANAIQYRVTTDDCARSAGGYLNSIVFGAIGGAVGGAAAAPLKGYLTVAATRESVGYLVSTKVVISLGRSVNSMRDMMAQFGAKVVAQNFVGANIQNFDATKWPGKVDKFFAGHSDSN